MRISPRKRRWQWFSLATITFHSTNNSFVLFAGADLTDTRPARILSQSAFYLCPFHSNSTQNLNTLSNICEQVSPGFNTEFFGASMKTLTWSNGEKSIVVICDPHYASNLTGIFPEGICYIYQANAERKTLHQIRNVTFCNGPCMGGYSLDLALMYGDVIRMYAGMPYRQPQGEVRTLDNLMNLQIGLNPNPSIGTFFHYGFALAATRESAFVSSPSTNGYAPNVTLLYRNQPVFIPPSEDEFSSFGTVMASITLNSLVAVLISAPHTTVQNDQNTSPLVNAGRVYLGCESSQSKMLDYVNGTQENEYFGYSVTGVGDLDGDGYDEFAVGAPFLRSKDKYSGLVYIFRTGSPCIIHKEPWQVLNYSRDNDQSDGTSLEPVQHFGYLLDASNDLDFDNVRDLVVSGLNTNNQIFVYRSKIHLQAKCEYLYSKLHADSTVRKGNEFSMAITVRLFNEKTNTEFNYYEIKLDKIIQLNVDVFNEKPRFETRNLKIDFTTDFIELTVDVRALMDAEDMNLLQRPVTIALRDVSKDENSISSHVINWNECRQNLTLKAFDCNNECKCDVSLKVNDRTGSLIHYLSRQWDNHRIAVIIETHKSLGFAVKLKLNITSTGAIRLHSVLTPKGFNLIVNLKNTQNIEVNLDSYFKGLVNLTLQVYFDFNMPKYFQNSSIFYNLSTLNEDLNPTDNHLVQIYQVILEPKINIISLSNNSVIFDNRSSAVSIYDRAPLNDLGPQIEQKYVIENVGDSKLYNVSLSLEVPFKLDERGSIPLYVVYLFSELRILTESNTKIENYGPKITTLTDENDKNGKCVIPKWAENPENIRPFIRSGKSGRHVYRRSVDNPPTAVANETRTPFYLKFGPTSKEDIRCGQSGRSFSLPPSCVIITCTVPSLSVNKPLLFTFRSRLWAKTFFHKKIQDVEVHTKLTATLDGFTPYNNVRIILPPVPANANLSQRFFFNQIRPQVLDRLPIWPIILGILLGCLLLLLLIVVLYKCGFFQRKRFIQNKKQSEEIDEQNQKGATVITHSERENVPMYNPNRPPDEEISLL